MVIFNDTEVLTQEEIRLKQDKARTHYWKKWGPYISERQWGTVREDYSADGDAWSHFPHEQSRSRVYRWGEDGIAGVSDTHCYQCIAFAFWNEKDPILKERLFGLSNPQGNHGESIKECHFHVDNVPSHSYMKYLYKYPQQEFPYEHVMMENAKRSRLEPEYNLLDTKIFDEDRYWDIFIETAKEADKTDELVFRITAWNRGPDPAPLHIIPHMWFRNTWAWNRESSSKKPFIQQTSQSTAMSRHWKLGERHLQFSPSPGVDPNLDDVHPLLMFTENDSNNRKLWSVPNSTKHVKDAFHRRIVNGETDAINPNCTGTKCAAWYAFNNGNGVPPGECAVVRFSFSQCDTYYVDEELVDEIIEQRKLEADEFYLQISPLPMTDDLRNIQRQAFSGMLWCKQFYYFIWDQWANGDPGLPPPPPGREHVRNQFWKHMYLEDILSMPDSWEYTFFAAWDSAFHCIPLAMIDPEFAKKQLDLFTREWYMHPNGQIPAYEWNFGDVNPPVHAWSTFRTFKIERKMYGREDLDFLERVFQKLLLNFTWWVNRKDFDGKNIFEGGFLGLDNIGLFNRSDPLPTGGVLEQADSTGWMAFYCLGMLNISLELAKHRRIYEDIASKFFEHFLLISDAMRFREGGEEKPLWNEEDGFYYDAISWGGPWSHQMPVRSLVGLIPLFATLTLEPEVINKFPDFRKRLEWFIENRPEVAERNIASMKRRGKGDRLLLSLVNEDRLKRILSRMLDEKEFLSEYGVRSLSKYHKDYPYSMNVNGQHFEVKYLPGDSDSGLFGGNSNWRGPIWIAVNFLLIESLLRFYLFYGDSLLVECPTGSKNYMHLGRVADNVQQRLCYMFAIDEFGKRPLNGGNNVLDYHPYWNEFIWYFEYFNGDSGAGLGASHQCGWTGLIAKIIHDVGINCRTPQTPKTPFASAAHYFDDIFSRSRRLSEVSKHKRQLSRSRSIGARSDWNASVTDDKNTTLSRSNSVGYIDEEGLKQREEWEQHVTRFVNERMERLQAGEIPGVVDDELEA